MAIEASQLDAFGVEVTGIDPLNLSEGEKRWLYQLWLDNGLVIFRGIGNEPKVQLGLAECFGPIQKHPYANIHVDGEPRLIFLGNEGGTDNLQVHLVDSELRRGFLYWHADLTYVPAISKGAMLGMRAVPKRGGDTEFADTALAYDELPENLKARIEGVDAVHVAAGTPRRAWGMPSMSISVVPREGNPFQNDASAFPPVLQPLVITHNETGRKSLLLSALNFVKIPGLPEAEGEALFEELMSHVLKPEFRYRHRWSVGDLVVWDNRRTMHFATGYPMDETRMAIRATLDEVQQTGKYFVE